MAIAIPRVGLRLAQAPPPPADPYKRDKIPQSIVLDASADGLNRFITAAKHSTDCDLAASFGVRTVIEIINRSNGTSSKEEISSKAVERSLKLSENGFLYKTDADNDVSTFQARLDIRLPAHKRGNEENDEALLALTRGLSNAQAQKQSHRTTLAQPTLTSKRRKPGQGASLISQLVGNSNPKAHRSGLFDRSKQLSNLGSSPQYLSSHGPTPSAKDAKKAARETAWKKAFIHLLAVKACSKSEIARTLKCALLDIEHLIERFAQPSRSDSTKLSLKDRAYRLIDPYNFRYLEEDRKVAIENAVEAFDRIRLSKSDKEWQMLLPASERGKGKCLSKLADKMLTADAPHPPVSSAAPEARTTPVPEISVSDVEAIPLKPDGQVSRKRPAESMEDESSTSITKKAKPGSDNFQKRLFATPDQREREKAKEKAKEAKKLAKSANPQPTSKATKKQAEPKSTAMPAGKVKSSEFVTASDDEEADAVVEKAEAAQARKPRPKSKSSEPGSTNASIKPSSSTPLTKKSAEGSGSGKDASIVAKKAAAISEKVAKASAWDFSQNKKPTANTLSRPSARPSAARSGNLHHRKQLSGSNHSLKNDTSSPSPRIAATGSTKPAAKLPDKPASQRSDLVRKLDSAKRNPANDPKASRSATIKDSSDARTDRPYATTQRPDRTFTSSAGRSATPSTPLSGQDNSSKSQPVQRSISHQRKSSSPLKPSPLAASPPINFSDVDDPPRSNRFAANMTNEAIPRKSVTASDNSGTPRPLKRKADNIGLKDGNTPTSAPASGQRPAKRRETGTAAPGSAGAGAAASSRSAEARQSDAALLNTRRYSQEATGQRSHSPSPASSTIGSTSSTKATSASIMSSNGKDRSNSLDGKPTASASTGNTKSNNTGAQPTAKSQPKTSNKDKAFKGLDKAELLQMVRFEEQREQYNRKQREVASMENPPLEKVRELNKLFHSLETQKKVLAAFEEDTW